MSAPWLRKAAGVVVAVGVLLMLRAGSLAPTRIASAGASVLRLSWSARPERIETCRRLTDAEMAALPAHMRLRWQCEGHYARYLLTVTVDQRVIVRDTVRGGGLRHDRPLHLFREYAMAPGAHGIAVRLARLDSSSALDSAAVGAGTAAADREHRETQERRVRRAEALPPVIALDTATSVTAGHVLLVTYTDTDRRLTLRGAP